MFIEAFVGGVCGAAGVLAYGVRGRSSKLFGPSVHRGPGDRPAVALTFDDGPSESTPALLDLLADHAVPATFFVCGANVRRLPLVAATITGKGHEVGNHSDSHPALYFRSPAFIFEELRRAQESIAEHAGYPPKLFRAPFGARWFGLRDAQQRLGLLGVMWTILGRDWKLPAHGVVERIVRGASAGAIICLHDGRQLQHDPDIQNTMEALRCVIPELRQRGFRFVTVSQLLCPTT